MKLVSLSFLLILILIAEGVGNPFDFKFAEQNNLEKRIRRIKNGLLVADPKGGAPYARAPCGPNEVLQDTPRTSMAVDRQKSSSGHVVSAYKTRKAVGR